MSDRQTAASEAWTAMVRILRSEEMQRRFEEVAGAEGLTPRQMGTLLSVPDRPAQMSALADLCQTSASFMTSIVDGLEDQGLVERRPDPDDRRVTLVAVTETGRACLGRCYERLAEPPSGFAALSAREMRTLRDLVQRVAEPYPWGSAEPIPTPTDEGSPAGNRPSGNGPSDGHGPSGGHGPSDGDWPSTGGPATSRATSGS